MAKIIEAKAVISAEDKTGAVFDKIAKKIDGIAKSAKSSKAIDEMSKAIERAKVQMVAIDKLDMSRGNMATARQRFNEAKTAVEGAAKAMAASVAPTRDMASAYKRAQREVAAASREFENQKNIAIGHKRAVQDMGVNVNKAAAHQANLRAAVEKTSVAIEKQGRVEERRQARRVALGTALAAGGAMAAHGVTSGAKATLHTYREFDKERRFGKAVMGLTDDEQAPLVKQAIHMGATTKFNDIQVLEAQRELAARGLKKDQIMGMMEPASQLGMSMDLKLPDAVKQMEGAIFGFKKDISTLPAALASAKRTADLQVKAAKISGMTPDDLTGAYKYGATPARLSGVSEETLLAFAGISKKANMGGDESGVAFRALMAAGQAPTRGAKEAMLANGMNFKNYQKNPTSIALNPFAENVASQYGVKLNKGARAGLSRIFTDKDMISDPAKFTPAVLKVLGDELGGSDAKSKRSIAGMANRYRSASMNGVDMNAFIEDLMTKVPGNLQLANAIFGSKQGGRIATALGDPDTFKKMRGDLEHGSTDYAGKIAGERMAGFDGAVSRFEGAIKNLETAVGRSFDSDGKGGLLTGATDFGARITQWLAERDSKTLAGGSLAAGAGGLAAGGYGAYKFLQILTTGGGLTASAAALDGAAAALTAAAGTMAGGSVAGKVAAAAGGLGVAGIAGTVGLLGAGIGATYMGLRYAPAMGGTGPGSRTRAGTIGGAPIGMTMPDFEDMAPRAAGSRAGRASSIWNGERGATRNYLASYDGSGKPSADWSGGPSTVSVTGEMNGQATMTIKIEAPELLKVMSQAEAIVKMGGALRGNGPGSTGRSSPDAAAPSVGAPSGRHH